MYMYPLTRRAGVWIEPVYRIELSGAATVEITVAGSFIPQLAGNATLTVTGAASLTNGAILAGAATVDLTGAGTLATTALSGNAPISLTLASSGTIFRGLIIEPVIRQSRAVYRGYVVKTGEADLEIPVSSFQARRRDGEPSYLAMVVPNPGDYLTALNALSGGQIVIKAGFADVTTGEETLAELERADWDYFRYDLGPMSGSATLSGHRTVAARAPVTRTLTGISYKAVTDGIRTVRCEPDMYLAPGDTADLGDETFVVASISYTVSPRQAFMEVQEVEVA